jgi:hypothetical protein
VSAHGSPSDMALLSLMTTLRSALRPPRSSFRVWAGTALSSGVLDRRTITTTSSKAALRAELEAALANYRGPARQCPAAPPPEEELEIFDEEDEVDEEVPGLG